MREFALTNSGTLDIKNVNLATNYTVSDLKDDNGSDDFGKHIKVKFLWNWDKGTEPVFETTLHDLKAMSPDVVQRDIMDPLLSKKSGLATVKQTKFGEYEFVDNGDDQNIFQGDSLSLDWTFNATQKDGEVLE